MDYVLLAMAAILVLTGIVGCIIPILPGLPLAYSGLILLSFTSFITFSTQYLVVLGFIVTMVSLLDYFVPIFGSKLFGVNTIHDNSFTSLKCQAATKHDGVFQRLLGNWPIRKDNLAVKHIGSFHEPTRSGLTGPFETGPNANIVDVNATEGWAVGGSIDRP